MQSRETTTQWTNSQVYVMAIICLLLGVAVGYLVRGAGQPTVAPNAQAAAPTQTASNPSQPTPEQMKAMADAKAGPLLQQLALNPRDPQLLAAIGNIYYDTQNFSDAIGYYTKSLAIKDDPSVRTDMGTAYYYTGDPDRALAEYSRTLQVHPNFENALLNTGMVKFQAKMDAKGAIAAWEQFLKIDPNTPRRAEIQQLIDQARKHLNVKAGQKANAPAM